jgi:hypothetical protein
MAIDPDQPLRLRRRQAESAADYQRYVPQIRRHEQSITRERASVPENASFRGGGPQYA